MATDHFLFIAHRIETIKTVPSGGIAFIPEQKWKYSQIEVLYQILFS